MSRNKHTDSKQPRTQYFHDDPRGLFNEKFYKIERGERIELSKREVRELKENGTVFIEVDHSMDKAKRAADKLNLQKEKQEGRRITSYEQVDHRIVAATDKLVKGFEGYEPGPYTCPAGECTIGYGTTHLKNGAKITYSHPKISEEQATAYMHGSFDRKIAMIDRYAPGMLDKLQRADPHAAAGYLSVMYNMSDVAAINITKTADKILDNGGTPNQIADFIERNYSGGKAINGKRFNSLTERREIEVAVMRGDDLKADKLFSAKGHPGLLLSLVELPSKGGRDAAHIAAQNHDQSKTRS